jgi:hypothetical protein
MEHLITKLNQIEDYKKGFDNWSLEEQKQLLELYRIICEKEHHIFKLIYNFHRCDSWEDIFRDYDTQYLDDKSHGVQIAIDVMTELIERQEKEKNKDK